MQFPVGAAAVGFSAAAAEGVQRTGEEGLAAEKDFEEFRELLLDGTELGAESAEITWHGLVSRAWGWSVGYYTHSPTDFKRAREKILGRQKKVKRRLSAEHRRGPWALARETGRGDVRPARTGFCSSRAVRTRLAASYATPAALPLTSESLRRSRR